MDKPQAEVDQHPPVTHSPDHVPAKTPDLNPAPDADGFVTLSSTESEKHIDSQTQSPEGESVNRVSSASRKSVHWSPELVSGTDDGGSNPYVTRDPAPSFNLKETVGTVKDVLGRWGKKVGEATKKAEVLAGNTWQHFKTGPSFAEAAMGRLAQGTKVLAEGGYEKIFRQTFDTVPEEQLLDCYACYLSTSAGPVMGVLYVSTAKLAYCSDSPLSYKNGSQTEWSYYKVIIPLHQLKAVNPSTSKVNPSEKYMQVISADNHEFWFMGFLNYDGAVQCLEEAFNSHKL